MAPDVLPPSMGRSQSHRPYFEILIVTAACPPRAGPRSLWNGVGFAGPWTRLSTNRSLSEVSKTRSVRRC